MADDDLEEQVTCWVCFEVMEDPTTLGCSHSFCKDCLVKVYKRDPNCPFCRRPFGLPLPEPNPDLVALVERIKGPKAGSSADPEPRPAIDQESPLLDLPVEVTSHIFDFLEPTSLVGAGKVCRFMREVADDPWVWRSLCMERFPFVGGGAENNDWKRIYLRRSRLQKGWDGGKSGDFTVTSMRGHDGYINCIDILKNQAISGGSTGQIKVWRTNTSKLSYECVGHTSVVSSVKFNDIYILSGSADHTVKLWDTQTGTMLRSMETSAGVTSLAFNANNVISCSGGYVDVHDIRSAERLVHQSRGSFASKVLFVDEHLFVASRADGVHVFDMRANPDAALHSLNRAASQMEVAGNDLLALTCGNDVVLYNAKTGANAWTCRLPGDSAVTALKADSASVVLGTASGQLMIMKHRNPGIRNVVAHDGSVNSLQFDTHRVVTAGADNSIKVFDVKSGKMLYTLLGGSLQLRGGAVAHPTRPGCSNLVYDENRIVGSFANILKSFNFGGSSD